MTTLDAARWYLARKFCPIPIPYKEKAPAFAGWQELQIDESNVTQYFNGERQNIGVRLGDYNLCDFDLDVEEARWAWMEVGLDTGFIFGHAKNPNSHHFVYTDVPARTMQFDDPEPPEGMKARILEFRSYGSHGKPGLQTVVPPSTHPSGEPIEFVKAGEPTTYEKLVAETAARHTAAAVVLARHLKEGIRHQAFLSLAGALVRNGWHEEKAAMLVRAVYRVLWHEHARIDEAEKEVATTFEKHARGEDTTGLRTLSGFLPQAVFRKITQWLGLKEDAGNAPAAKTKALPEMIYAFTLKDRTIVMPELLIEDLLTTPGLYLITAPSKAGKTILSVQMAMCLANGIALFDNYKTIQAPALLLEWDDPMGNASIKSMVLQCRASRDSMPFYYIHPGDTLDPLNFADPQFAPYLEEKIRESGARFIVLDSYTRLRGQRGRDGDIVKVESNELMALAQMAHRLRCTIVLIHHESKSSASLQWSDRGAGSFAIGAVAEGLIRIARFQELPEADGARLISVRGRHLRGTELVVRFKPDSLDFDLVLDGSASRDYPDLVQLRRAFPGESFNAKDISNDLGWSRPTTYRLMNRLVMSNVLRKESSSWSWDPSFNARYL